MILDSLAQPAAKVPDSTSNTGSTDVSSSQLLDFDVAIAGGGLVGLTLACALQYSGLKVAIIEAQPQSSATAKGQAYNISPLTCRIFQDVGVWDEIEPHVAAYREIALSDAEYSHVVRFQTADLEATVLGHVAEHRTLLTALRNHLQNVATVSWLCPAELVEADYQPEFVQLTLQIDGTSNVLKTKLLVAADGARSRLRQQAGISVYGWRYWQSCVVAFIKPEQHHQNIAYERFWPSGPFAILPLSNGTCRIVWTAPHAEAERLLALDESQFLAELRHRYGNQMGELSLVGDRFIFPVQLQQSSTYIQPRLALIGDAAHCCHPVGGQGLNLGIRDAAALAEILQVAHLHDEDLGNLQVLRRYERWRKWENLMILAFTDFLVRCFSNQWLPLVILRRIGLRLLQRVKPLRKITLRLMTGLNGRLPQLVQPSLRGDLKNSRP
jgi:2-octaprenyl-6-methoxyphenol hydroxylase